MAAGPLMPPDCGVRCENPPLIRGDRRNASPPPAENQQPRAACENRPFGGDGPLTRPEGTRGRRGSSGRITLRTFFGREPGEPRLGGFNRAGASLISGVVVGGVSST